MGAPSADTMDWAHGTVERHACYWEDLRLDQRRFEVLFSRLCAIAAKVEPLTLENATMKGMWYGPRGFFILPPEATSAYQQFLTDILRHADWEQKFSRQYLNTRLRPVIEDYTLAGEAAARVAL